MADPFETARALLLARARAEDPVLYRLEVERAVEALLQGHRVPSDHFDAVSSFIREVAQPLGSLLDALATCGCGVAALGSAMHGCQLDVELGVEPEVSAVELLERTFAALAAVTAPDPDARGG